MRSGPRAADLRPHVRIPGVFARTGVPAVSTAPSLPAPRMPVASTPTPPPRPPAPVDPADALGAALDDALARMVPTLAAPPEHRATLRAALLALLAALDQHDPLPVAEAERAFAPLETEASRAGAAFDPALATLRALLDRARALAA